MEDGGLQPQALLPGAEGPEVLCRLRDDVGEKLHGDGAQQLVIGGHVEEHQGVRVSGVLLDSGHLRRGDTRHVAFRLGRAALALAEGLLEGFGYLGGFELGRQLLHCAVAVLKNRRRKSVNESSAAKHQCTCNVSTFPWRPGFYESKLSFT